jgi:hypothetical protein
MGKRQEEFMNAIELLKEARDELGAVQHYFPAQDEADKGLAVADVDACQRLMTKIEAYLAEPEPDAMEIVEKIRDYYIYHPEAYDDYAVANFTLPEDEAAALIADYGRRVPREMLDEIWDAGCEWNGSEEPKTARWEDINEIAAKYGSTKAGKFVKEYNESLKERTDAEH